MAELKTRPTGKSVTAFIAGLEDRNRQKECRALLKWMREVTGLRPRMWGTSMIGYGSYHYRYPTGNEGDWFLTGFSPRKSALTIYIMTGFESSPKLMSKLGKFKTGKSCLYVKKLDDIDLDVLRELIDESLKKMREIDP